MDISKISLLDLKSLFVQIPKEIERREKEEKIKIRKEIEEFAAARGFALSELLENRLVKKDRAVVPVKFSHPSNATLTWTGRGRQPKWVSDFLLSGGTLDQLTVQNDISSEF